ncbi:MAG: peptide chain release factor N(5)-glutamine methyltransferase [Bacteroidota bacterium]
MTLPEVKEFIMNSLSAIYDKQETLAIANTLLSHVLSPAVHQSFDNIAPSKLHASDIANIKEAVKRLLKKEPLQYILEEAWFYNLPFLVNKHVLIPRPETEELVDLIINEYPGRGAVRILDIGTGSGCIPVTLKKNIELAEVYGLDVSGDALLVASANAQKNRVQVQWVQADILLPGTIKLPKLDIIVSNPPYITEAEKKEMHANVLEYEPHLALFVDDTNPLQFYEAISKYASSQLKKGGQLYFEINASYGNEVKACMEQHGFNLVTIIKDMQGKNRFVSGRLA